ncbi:MAG TPA: nucleotidyltransferase family protein [Gemmatimonadales bacterium]|nr:nucleotidyltransferase family protein [Gemmatimonadales bacterium]
MSLAGIVLAGGRSSRMGSPKALLDFRGEPFVLRILEAFEALDLKTRVVVVGPGVEAQEIRSSLSRHECLVVENPDVDGGPIASLRAGLKAIQSVAPTGAVVWPVDLPHVRVDTVERLLDVFRRNSPFAAVPRFGNRRGHPVIWSSAAFAELEGSEAARRDGARVVLRAHQADIKEVPVDDPAVIDDLNTPEDYERLVREINRDAY